MHWINMTLVTSVRVYPEEAGGGARVGIWGGDALIGEFEFQWLPKAEQFVQHLMTESEGWIDADFYADLAAGRMK